MAFDTRLLRSEGPGLLERVRVNIDTARRLCEQSTRALQQAQDVLDAIDRARFGARARQALGDCVNPTHPRPHPTRN